METIECKDTDDVPKNYTGIAVFPNGAKFWYKEGKSHRLDGPAREYANGIKAWWVDGKRHRIDGPAVEDKNGLKEWWINGNLHREDGPAIEWASGKKEWWVDGVLHRIDGPAVECRKDGRKEWWIDGKEHSFYFDIRNKVFLGKEKGRYNLEWLKFMTETGIEEIPIMPGAEYELKISLSEYLKLSKR